VIRILYIFPVAFLSPCSDDLIKVFGWMRPPVQGLRGSSHQDIRSAVVKRGNILELILSYNEWSRPKIYTTELSGPDGLLFSLYGIFIRLWRGA